MIDPDVAFNHGVAHRVALALATIVVGQTLTSESDVPFEPFTAAFAVGHRVTATTFVEALGFEAGRQAVLGPAARFFEQVAASTDDPGAQQVFAVLEHVMRRSLTGLTQVFVRGDGIVAVPFFLFGRLAGGPLVGLRSIAIET
jgi:Nuclease A inhibitor-like protein